MTNRPVTDWLIETEDRLRTWLGVQPLRRSMSERTPFGVKVGDRIKIISSRPHDYDGQMATVKRLSGSSIYVAIDGTRYSEWGIYEDEDRIERIPKNLATLIEGDIVLDDDGDEHKVLALITSGIYLLSDYSNPEHAGDIYTAKELEDNGWSVKYAAPAEVKKSVADIEKELGMAPGTLHVVKD